MKEIKALILDMDGVLWRSSKPLADLPSVFGEIKRRGWQVSLATNNSTNDVQGYVDKLAQFEVKCTPDQIINSSLATIHLLKNRYNNGARVFVVGEFALEKTLSDAGFVIVNNNADVVVVGLDRHISYQKLAQATTFIRAGALFIATNPDKTFPSSNGIQPGAGSIVAAVQAATDVSPEIAGKPEPHMYQVALERMHVAAENTLVVGDRLETDIAGAQALGCQSALVLSGVTRRADALKWSPRLDWIVEDIHMLLEIL